MSSARLSLLLLRSFLLLLSSTFGPLKGQALSPGRYQVLQGEVVYRARTALSEWTGRNESLTGYIIVVVRLNDGYKLGGKICLNLNTWDSGNPLRDAHTRKMFETDRYPLACFFPSLILLQGQNLALQGELELHGKRERWGLKGEIEEERVSKIGMRLLGQVNLATWNLKPPQFLGLKVEETVDVVIRARIASNPENGVP